MAHFHYYMSKEGREHAFVFCPSLVTSGDFHTTPKTANAEMTAEDYEDLRLAFAEYVSGGMHEEGGGLQCAPQYAMGGRNAAGTPFMYPALRGFDQPQNTAGQAMENLPADVKMGIGQKLRATLEHFIRTGKLPQDVSIFKNKDGVNPFPLAQGNESSIIGADGRPLKTGTAMNLSQDGDEEIYWEDIRQSQTPTNSSMQTLPPIPTPTPTAKATEDTGEPMPTPTNAMGTIPTPGPDSYQGPYLYTPSTPAPRKDTMKGVQCSDDQYSTYQQWAEQYFQEYGSMPEIILPSAAAEGWRPHIKKIRYEANTVKTYSPTDVVQEAWGMIGEGTKLVADAVGMIAQRYTNVSADKVSEALDGILSVLTEPKSFEAGAQFLDKVYNTGGAFENMVKGVDQYFVDHTGDSYVQHTLTILWDGFPTPQNGIYTYIVHEGQKVDKDVYAGFENALFFGKERGWE